MPREQKGWQRHAAGQTANSPIEVELSNLSELTIKGLRACWIERFGADPPAVRSRDVLLRIFAWRTQAKALGGLDAATERKLREIAKALERDGTYEPKIRHDLSPGVVLTREWKGITHKVTATAEGYQHLGRRHKSLSDIARAITGTRWSGPRFFGLEQKSARPSRKASS
jgi:hypothetical protein